MVDKSIFDKQKEVTLPDANGFYSTQWKGVNLEYIYKAGNKRLVVFLSALYPGSGKKFQRWTYANSMMESVICFLDPMYSIIQDKNQGYYYGTDKIDFRMVVAEFVTNLAIHKGISFKDIYLVGDSNAATAALFIKDYINESNCIAINPQLTWSKYSERLQDFLNKKLKKDRFEVLPLIQKTTTGRCLLLFNRKSPQDIESIDWLSKMINKDIDEPIEIINNNIVWTFNTEYIDNHVSIDDCIIFRLLLTYFECWGNIERAILINEIWTTKYDNLRNNQIEIIKTINAKYDYAPAMKFFEKCGYKYISINEGGGGGLR